MSDYIPDPRRPDPLRTDPYGTTPRYEYTEVNEGRSTYAVVALLGIVALVGGVLMFTGPQQPADQQAQVPTTAPPIERTTPAPAERTMPAPAARPEAPIGTPMGTPAERAPAAPATPQQ
jgi:hypothetical protein